jgi:hypothetical protein
VRLTIGVLWEARGLIEKRFLSSKLGKEFVPKLDADALAALESLKKRFGSTNWLAKLRNSYAFHHPDMTDMEAAFQQAAAHEKDDDDWAVYFTRTQLNCFFFMSDFVIAHGMTAAAGETDILAGHKKILNDLGTDLK